MFVNVDVSAEFENCESWIEIGASEGELMRISLAVICEDGSLCLIAWMTRKEMPNADGRERRSSRWLGRKCVNV
jgi:hypothetical protein